MLKRVFFLIVFATISTAAIAEEAGATATNSETQTTVTVDDNTTVREIARYRRRRRRHRGHRRHRRRGYHHFRW